MLDFGGLLAMSMIIAYFICYTGLYPAILENYEFGGLNAGYLFTSETMDSLTPMIDRNIAKALTMLMVTLYFCETILVLQIRRPNKSLIKCIQEDSNKRMYLILGSLFAVFLVLMYVPGIQVGLANLGINFMFMYLTGIDWIVCFLISLITIMSFEGVKYFARKKEIYL
jgi:magnesium-transporting ATPase (P-type)